MLTRTENGQRQLVMIAGEPGIGKTRLAREFVVEAHARGASILYGRSDEEALVPYQPIVEALHYAFASSASDNDMVSEQEIDDYLANLDEPKRSTLSQLRQTIVQIIPDAEQCISYGMPAFRLHGKVVAGFAAFRNHLSYLPQQWIRVP